MNKMKITKFPATIFALILLLFTTSATGQNKYNKVDKNGFKQGKWVKMWNNGMVKYKGTFKDNKPTGEFKYFYPSGKLKSVMTFLNDGNKAHNISYHENGKKMAEGDFVNQKKVGKWEYYSDLDEKLVSKENYKDGELNGNTLTYYIDEGKPFELIEYKNGKKNGKWIKYFMDGSIMTETTYVNNKLEGVFKNFDPNGTLIVKGQYNNGEMDGIWEYYDETGKFYRKEVYSKGVLVKTKELEDKYSQ